ncbi:MAG: isochorismatase [Candidatus Bipolaricaulia bacterium]
MSTDELPTPAHFDPTSVDRIWRVPYGQRAEEAEAWARDHAIAPAHNDKFKLALMLVDVQNTFCIPGFELFVAGRSGNGAVEDNVRLCRFIYRNLHRITQITPTMDTHDAMQIFHPIFLVDEAGNHPAPLTLVSKADVDQGRWRFNPDVAPNLGITPEEGQRHLEHYVEELSAREKYDLTIWPYHVMLGGISHALVPAIEEAVFFHTIARMSQPDHEIKGLNPLTEHYSVLGPEVRTNHRGDPIAAKNDRFIQKLRDFDAVAIAGQAKSHCVAWTIDDLLTDISETDPSLARKVYLLEDCTSPVVVPEVVDYTDDADAAFERFADAGMHVVQSTDPIEDWPGLST